jgi:REP element-mobilizing transposase RayT
VTFGYTAYRRRLPHFQSDYRVYFVTFVTRGRRELPPYARDIVFAEIVAVHERMLFLHCAVIMPDHVHLIGAPLLDAQGFTIPLFTILKSIKGRSSRFVNQLLSRTGALWLDESYDHQLRNDESLSEKCEYICNNPVRAGLVANQDEYRWLWRQWVEG